MLPTNVMSFMKKMVTTQPEPGPAGSVTPEESGTTFSKLRQLGSGLITATGNVTKLTPAKVTSVEEIQPKQETSPVETPKPKPEHARPASRTGACRVCLKSFKPDDFSKTCNECQHKVCEDCASYSTTVETDDTATWRCSVCRRKVASRVQPVVTQESTDSLLDVPVLEALQRRHSDARLGCQTGSNVGGISSGLAPPRSPELRRHSDVSPASLKELEKFRKVAGERCEELRWERELEWRSKSRSGSPERRHGDHRGDRGDRAVPADRIERNDWGERLSKQTPSADFELTEDLNADEEEERRRHSKRSGGTIRRKSRVARQRSYDDEVKSGGVSGSSQPVHTDAGLNLPVQLPRRASAYDVYATPGASGLNAMAIAAAQQRASMFAQAGAREPEERSVPSRRPSFRAVKSVLPYDMEADEEKVINLDTALTSEVTASQAPALVLDDDRRSRRRGSQLPDINAIRSLPVAPAVTKGPSTNMARATVDDRELPRQGSLADGEGIKIVIHDVDSDLVPRTNSKRRMVLRRDPVMDKGHRARGFGMRVVGGKTGVDGRMFAYIVWTVPGGPADKAGLQQGDKVLEWGTVSLIDRSFEEVAQIMERTGDVAELVVEHATDIIGDLLDDPGMVPSPGKPSGSLGLQLETETDKTPSSPTRRKLPKTPEQIAKEKQVTGRVQIQVWYEAERKELVVSVLAGDELCTREDTGYGTAPEAYAKLRLVPACGDQSSLKTDVAEPTQNPIWNATLNFSGVPGDDLMDRSIEVTLWDYCPDRESVFMGECTVELQKAFLDDRAV
ncbi:regulating synaptic membrane exocytosis protein 1 isoform X1 [Neodiprion lecontei]|uniref:Regulating synaptic membrane exocytosis protein 1 isoform X1 n=1 Tax=Neodiprion lecontei TaxID=441921 RepID=A0ABM3GNJ9_NEOLC|nr:regulating synaptic membrane exocytosis protein 1 isoform X1 [Neodiprion lecontei]